MSEVLARKWRPRCFEEVVGQDHVVRALTYALQSHRLHHAYLFTGTRGVGKTSLTRILAKCLNCEQGITTSPCQTCVLCRGIDEGRCIDFLEMDAATNTRVDDVRELLEHASYVPCVGRFKVYVVDEVHMLSSSAFHALLKILEEPPAYLKFIFATTDPQKIPLTVLSRCLQLTFRDVSVAHLVQQLAVILEQEKVPYEDMALKNIAQVAQGSVRDALSLLDQAIAYGQGSVTQAATSQLLGLTERGHVCTILQLLLDKQLQDALCFAKQLLAHGVRAAAIISDMARFVHDCAIARLAPQAVGADGELVSQFAQQMSNEQMQLCYQILIFGYHDLQFAPDEETGLSIVLLRIYAFSPQQGAVMCPQTPISASVEQKKEVPSLCAAAPPPAPPPAVLCVPQHQQDWVTLVVSLSLTGGLKQIAESLVWCGATGDIWQMRVDNSAQNLLKVLKSRLEYVLGEYYSRSIRLVVSVGGSTDTPSVTEKRHLEQSERQSALEASVYHDVHVVALCERFGASIDEGSVSVAISTDHKSDE